MKINSINDTLALQNNLDLITKWSISNNMKLNSTKFEYINHKSNISSKNLELLNILPFSNQYSQYFGSDSVEILKSSHVRDLGIIVDDNLNWKMHIDNLTKTCKKLCSWALNVFYNRSKDIMLTLFFSIIRTKLEFCCEIWSPFQIQDIVKIEQIQRSFTSRISGMKTLNYWERLDKLQIQSLQRRREKIIIVHLWKICNGIYPNSIDINFKLHSRTNSLKAIIKPLPKIRGKILTLYDESFTVKAAKLWNVLPNRLTQISSLDQFRESLDRFLLTVPDKPPLPGYPYNCNNSLTCVCA